MGGGGGGGVGRPCDSDIKKKKLSESPPWVMVGCQNLTCSPGSTATIII